MGNGEAVKMVGKRVVAVGLSGLMAIGMVGCTGSSEEKEPVEIVNEGYGEYYVDGVKYSGVKTRNYEGYFLADGMSIAEALKLEDLDSLVFGWEWEILDETYTGGEIKIPEEDQERLEKEAEEREAQEEAERKAKEEEERLKKEAEEAARKEAEEKGEEYIPPEEEEPEEVEEEEEVDPNRGSCVSISEVLSLETILYPGQVLRVVPVFEYIPPEEPEGEVSEENGEGTAEGSDGEVEPKDSGEVVGEGTEEVTDEAEEAPEEPVEIPKPKPELLKYVEIVNYLEGKSTTVADCVGRMWYSVSFLNYDKVFKLSPEDGNSFTTDISLFEKLSEALGYPTSVWESDTEASEYAIGKRVESIAFEFPEYTIEGSVVEDGSGGMTIEGIRYIPSSLWLESDDFMGIRLLHASSDIEVVHDVIPTVEETKENSDSE